MDKFYTIIFRQIENNHIALCLENGITAEGKNKDDAIASLKDAISSFEMAKDDDIEILNSSLPIKELHEFLTIDGILQTNYELMPVYA